ncbi:MAG: hypothetical protein J6U01_10655, partial [Clostridia bacterium]|nr:hypothetical protein [Clostridia bacterium]
LQSREKDVLPFRYADCTHFQRINNDSASKPLPFSAVSDPATAVSVLSTDESGGYFCARVIEDLNLTFAGTAAMRSRLFLSFFPRNVRLFLHL